MASAAAAARIEEMYAMTCERVKMVDMHPSEPLFIGTLYNGQVNLWNYETQTLVRSFDTGANVPVRCVRFIARLQSFICGADDMNVRVYNYNTMERTRMFQAHDDFIRSIAVHEQLPVVLTSSDDMTIRQWDWSKGWALQMIYEGHTHYCMAVVFNPRDPSTFASASLDCSVRVWNIAIAVANFQLDGHTESVNCVEYYPHGDKPYLLSGSDDHTVRLWDYQMRACLQVFELHNDNITAVLFHPDVPLIFSASEGTELKAVSSDTFRLLHSIPHGRVGRAWCMAARRHTNVLVVGFDHGVAVYAVGVDRPVYTMEPTSGRVLLAVGNELTRIDVKSSGSGSGGGAVAVAPADGDVLSNITSKDLGSVEAAARALAYAPGGQFIAVIGQGDYTIVSALSMRPRAYGTCVSFAWGVDKNTYAVLESTTTLHIVHGGGGGGGKDARRTVTLANAAERLTSGPLLGVQDGSDLTFYDWATLMPVRRIAGHFAHVQWSGSGEHVGLATDTTLYVLRYDHESVQTWLEQQQQQQHNNNSLKQHGEEEEGVEAAFDTVDEVDASVRDMTWVGECVVFVDATHRLCYAIGGEVGNVAVLTRDQYLLGYLARDERLLCLDKQRRITSYRFRASLVEYMAAILRDDPDAAAALLPRVEAKQRYRLAQFLQRKGHLSLALEVTNDEAHRFDLALQLGRLDVAAAVAARAPATSRWRHLADAALRAGDLTTAATAMTRCDDLAGLLLLYSSLNDRDALAALAQRALRRGSTHVAFTCCHLVGQHAQCVELLCRSGKAAEAALYARTYCPEHMAEAVGQWKVSLAALPRYRDALADPQTHPQLFPALQRAAAKREARAQRQRERAAQQRQHEDDKHAKSDDVDALRQQQQHDAVKAAEDGGATHAAVAADDGDDVIGEAAAAAATAASDDDDDAVPAAAAVDAEHVAAEVYEDDDDSQDKVDVDDTWGQ